MNDYLKEVKGRIKIETANPENNERLMKYLMDPEDCFGRKYNDEYPECVACQVLASLDGRKEPINVFCKEIVSKIENGKSFEIEGTKEEVKRALEEAKIPEKEEEKPKIKKREVKSMGNMTKLVRELLSNNTDEKDIVANVVTIYSQMGKKDEQWASGRAKAIIKAIKTGKDKKQA